MDILLGIKETDISSEKSYINKTNKKLVFEMGSGDLKFLISQLSPPQGSNEAPSQTTSKFFIVKLQTTKLEVRQYGDTQAKFSTSFS